MATDQFFSFFITLCTDLTDRTVGNRLVNVAPETD
jgi:hypothetical protein